MMIHLDGLVFLSEYNILGVQMGSSPPGAPNGVLQSAWDLLPARLVFSLVFLLS